MNATAFARTRQGRPQAWLSWKGISGTLRTDTLQRSLTPRESAIVDLYRVKADPATLANLTVTLRDHLSVSTVSPDILSDCVKIRILPQLNELPRAFSRMQQQQPAVLFVTPFQKRLST